MEPYEDFMFNRNLKLWLKIKFMVLYFLYWYEYLLTEEENNQFLNTCSRRCSLEMLQMGVSKSFHTKPRKMVKGTVAWDPTDHGKNMDFDFYSFVVLTVTSIEIGQFFMLHRSLFFWDAERFFLVRKNLIFKFVLPQPTYNPPWNQCIRRSWLETSAPISANIRVKTKILDPYSTKGWSINHIILLSL
jgi:hypothetical protein